LAFAKKKKKKKIHYFTQVPSRRYSLRSGNGVSLFNPEEYVPTSLKEVPAEEAEPSYDDSSVIKYTCDTQNLVDASYFEGASLSNTIGRFVPES
jgi:hypothetical protein